MKLWLINLGKAWSTLKREGVLRGVQRILVGAWNILPRRLSGDILIITSGVGDSARYRGEYVAEELRLKGFRVAVTTQHNPWLAKYADDFSVFIFHRTLYIGQVKELFDRAKALKKTLVFETDDLVYDPTYITKTEYYQKMNALEKKLYEHGVGGEILNDVQVCTTTTSYIAEKLREKGKKVFIVRNKLSQEDIAWIEKLSAKNYPLRAALRIGYASGTATHNKDFATITEALLKLLEAYPEIRLVIAGPLLLDDRFASFHERIERLPFASRRQHFKNLATLDINLAPLEVGAPFCEGKSELKWFEAGVLGVPTVAAATETFREAIRDGVDGFVAHERDEWYAKLERLIQDPVLRKTMGEEARKTVLDEYVTQVNDNQAYYDFLHGAITRNS